MTTQFWGIAGLPVHNLPTEIVTSPEDMVDVALAGLDRGEIVTIPSCPTRLSGRDRAPCYVREAFERCPGRAIQHQVSQSGRRADMISFVKTAGLTGILVAAFATVTPDLHAAQLNSAVREANP